MKLRLLTLGLFLVLWAAPAFGQCAMCYMTAKALNKDGQMAINHGVFILLVPPIGFMTAGVGMAYRYGKRRDEDSDD
jgi:tellurite resistance protein TehA-like permease